MTAKDHVCTLDITADQMSATFTHLAGLQMTYIVQICAVTIPITPPH